MAVLEIKLLGGLEIRDNGELLTFPTKHSGLLLACLALAPDMRLPRTRLMELLWADRADAQARGVLRQTLYRIRAVLGERHPDLIGTDRQHVWLDPAQIACDAVRFQKLFTGDDSGLAAALNMDSGEILAGYGVDQESFETWLTEQRSQFKSLAASGFYRLAGQLFAAERLDDLARAAQKLAAIDSFDERAHRLWMAVLACLNHRNQALQIYSDLAERLARELGVEPQQQTQAINFLLRPVDGAPVPGGDVFLDHVAAQLNPGDVSPEPQPATPAVSLTHHLEDRPYLAVLPFDNMSGDADQEYFSDAIAEDLIAALSRVKAFYVIARNSTFTYRGRAVQVKQVSQELGARYVIEGSVRRGGDQVRITVQLIDAEFDRHIWAERYQRQLGDIFALQDEITRTIVGAIEPELASAEFERASRKAPEDLSAWDCYNRGTWHCNKFVQSEYEEGLRLFDQAIALDPNLSRAYAAKAIALHGSLVLGYADTPKETIARAVEAGRQAVALDNKDALSHFGLGRAYSLTDDLEGAVTHFEEALAINPSYAHAHFGLITVQIVLGHPEKAVEHADAAIDLSPRDPIKWAFLQAKAHGLYQCRRYDEAVDAAQQATRYPRAEFWSWAWLAAALAQGGRIEEAKQAMATGLQKNKDSSLKIMRSTFPIRPTYDYKHTLEGLHKAGLPR